jgi:hypothetical protein
MNLRSRLSMALIPALLCLACGTGDDTETAAAVVWIAPRPTLVLAFPTASPETRALAASFLKLTLEYDAAAAGRLDFLDHLQRIATSAEVGRLRESTRAHLRWAALQARGEHTKVHVDGVTRTASATATVRVLVRLTVTTRTDFATIRTLEKATLTLVPSAGGWKVDHALGAGL